MDSIEEKVLKVLLIEDNPGDAFLIKFYLEEFNAMKYDLRHAELLEQGFSLLAEESFDIILLDLGLPDSTGIETVKLLLDKFPGNLVIVMTGLNDEDVGLETVKLGAQDFLVKGRFDGKVLNSSLRYAFERFQLGRKLKSFTRKLDYNEMRFDIIQEVAQMGYFELMINEGKVYMSNKFKELLSVNKTKDSTSIDGLKELVEEQEDLDHLLEDATKNKLPVSGQFTLAGKNKKAKIYLKIVNLNGNPDRIAGIIQLD